MKPARGASRDYRMLVRDGYDACAPTFNAERAAGSAAALQPLLERLPERSRVLDLGCGAGMPIAGALSARHDVVGVDLSQAQLALARVQAPGASYVLADMASCAFAPHSFDAVVSFYAIFHLPRQEHRPLFQRIRGWLRPGGYLLASLAMHDEDGYTEEFFGVEMYWSNYGIASYRAMLEECGFQLIEEGRLPHGYNNASDAKAETHPFVLAQRRE